MMTWLHIGHSFLTDSFLLKGEELPMCIGCDKRLTIEHILLTCLDFIEIRVTLQLNHWACYFRIFHLRRFLTFWKKLIFFEKFKLETFLVMFVFSPFKLGFKTVYRPILRHTHCVLPWCNCTGWLGVKHQLTYLLLLQYLLYKKSFVGFRIFHLRRFLTFWKKLIFYYIIILYILIWVSCAVYESVIYWLMEFPCKSIVGR